MNFFFLTSTNDYRATLSIPKFQNSGRFSKGMTLLMASIKGKKWKVSEPRVNESDDFWTIQSNEANKDAIYFIARRDESTIIEETNELVDLGDFTDGLFRSNLMIQSRQGGMSSYQAEYPYRMVPRLGALYSDCGVLTTEACKSVGVFIKNIHIHPIQDEATMYLYHNIEAKIIDQFTVRLNRTTYIDLTAHRHELRYCFLFAKDFLGIPIFAVEYAGGALSFEHTHPPHESISGHMKFQLVGKLKGKANDKVSLANLS